jgi:A/G-specific adenine glycosylase
MDLGATICTPKNPHCDECPFCDSCGAHTAHQEHHFPIRAKKPEVKERFLHYFFILHDHRIVMHKRGDRDIWKSLYEPFLIETAQSADLTQLHHPWLTGILKSHCVIRQHGKNIRHVLTHRILRANFYSIYLNDLPAILPEDYRFVPTEELQRLALPALIKKHLDWISDYNTTET